MQTIRLSMESRKSIFRIETLSEEINPEWAMVFRNCFKKTLVNHLENKEKNGKCQLTRGDSIHWLQRSAMQAGLYLPLVANDERIREMIINLLKCHFEFINRKYPSTIVHTVDHSELYMLAYPLHLAYLLYLRTEEISQFSLLFSSASSRVFSTWKKSIEGHEKKAISEKSFLIEVIQYMEEVFSNVTRHTELKMQSSNLREELTHHEEVFAQKNHELFRRGVLANTYQEKEKSLNDLIAYREENQEDKKLTELLFCQLLLNYFKY